MRVEKFIKKQIGKRIEAVVALRASVRDLETHLHCDIELKRLRDLFARMIIDDEEEGTLVVKGTYQSDPLTIDRTPKPVVIIHEPEDPPKTWENCWPKDPRDFGLWPHR